MIMWSDFFRTTDAFPQVVDHTLHVPEQLELSDETHFVVLRDSRQFLEFKSDASSPPL
jgi:hypothetical protein